ncbi:MAG: RNA repair domain-containing protein [Candidatus Aenigmatarchaeota archaeon]
MAFDILNKMKWTGNLGKCDIIILHRGAPKDRKLIKGSLVTGLDRHYFYYSENGRETTIPLHRVLEIWSEGKIIWKRKPEKKN